MKNLSRVDDNRFVISKDPFDKRVVDGLGMMRVKVRKLIKILQ